MGNVTATLLKMQSGRDLCLPRTPEGAVIRPKQPAVTHLDKFVASLSQSSRRIEQILKTMFPFPPSIFNKVPTTASESGPISTQIPRENMNFIQQLLVANHQYLATTMALLRGRMIPPDTTQSHHQSVVAPRLNSSEFGRVASSSLAPTSADRSEMRKVGALNVFAVRTPASSGAENNSEFHAVLYDGERVLEVGDTLDVSNEVLPLCHASASGREANIATANDNHSTSFTPYPKCKVLKRIQKGDELVRLLISASLAGDVGDKEKEPKKTIERKVNRDDADAGTSSAGYQCERCGKMFTYEYYREKHLKYTRCVDNGDRKFPCPLCSRSFEKRDRLRIHVLHVHENHRPHACSICGKAFSQSSSLNKHLRVHSGERPYQCSFCSKAFTASSILRTHIRQHSGEKPFKCVHCGKSFASHAAHDSHVRRSHNASGAANAAEGSKRCSVAVKPTPDTTVVGCDWRCVVCDKPFERRAQWSFHMNCFHPNI